MAWVHGDINSHTGNLIFDVNSDGTGEATLDNTGLGLGITASANLQVEGNAAFDGSLSIATSSDNSSLEIAGSLGFNIESVSANTTLSANSFVLVDTSSDNVLITLPYAGNVVGRTYTVKKTSNANKLWISGGGNLIDDLMGLEITSTGNQLPSIDLYSSGNQWYSFSSLSHIRPVASDNLVGWWKFDETSGNTAADSSASGLDGTLYGDTFTFEGNGITGKAGRALSFEAEGDDYVDLPNNNTIKPTQQASVSAWLQFLSATGTVRVFSIRGISASADLTLHLSSTTLKYQVRNDAAGVASADFTITTGVWYHVVGTWDGTTVKLFVNGIERDSAAISGTIGHAAGDSPEIGRWVAGSQHIHAYIDDLRLYNKGLDTAEVKAIYSE